MSAPAQGQGGWSFDVRVRAIRTYKGSRGTTYTARWTVAGREWQQTFATAKLADGYRSKLLVAARDGEAFSLTSGLPQSMTPPDEVPSWLEHCVSYVRTKWPHISPHHRKSVAETLTGVTVTLSPDDAARPDDTLLRRALYRYAFNATNEIDDAPEDVAEAYAWLSRTSIPITDLSAAPILREAMNAIGTNLDGTAAATSTIMRKRAVLHGCLQFAVESGHFTTNPLHELPRRRLPRAAAVDRRVVVNPDQARSLLGNIRRFDPELEGFFACIYYAGLRPAEALNLRLADCTLPKTGWGTLLLSTSFQSVGPAWTDGGRAGEERQLKHRDRGDTRPVPAHPELVAILRRHSSTFAQGVDGRLFVNRRGRAGVPLPPPYTKPVSMSTVYRVWHRAREATFTDQQLASPLSRRPYDLRHACLSTWLNAGVPPAQVAAWAGHTVAVLLQVYSKCIDGQDEAAKLRIEEALEAKAPAPQADAESTSRRPGHRPITPPEQATTRDSDNLQFGTRASSDGDPSSR